MTNFICPKCSRKLSSKQSLQRHLSKTIPCDLKCTKCSKKLCSLSAYKYHITNNVCGKKEMELANIDKNSCNSVQFGAIPCNLVQLTKKFSCDYCSKTYTHSGSRNRHMRACVGKVRQKVEEFNRNTKINKKSSKLAHTINKVNVPIIGDHNTVTNNNITNNNIIQITLSGQESLAHISDNEFKKIISMKSLDSQVELLKYIFFHLESKTNHKWYISDWKSKYGAMEYDHEKDKMLRRNTEDTLNKYLSISNEHYIKYLMEQPQLTLKVMCRMNRLFSKISD